MQPAVNPATVWTTIGMAVATLVGLLLKQVWHIELGADGMGAIATLLAFVLPFLAPDPKRSDGVLTEPERERIRAAIVEEVKDAMVRRSRIDGASQAKEIP